MGLMKAPPSNKMKNQQHVSRSIRLQNNGAGHPQQLVLPDVITVNDASVAATMANNTDPMPSDDEIEELFSKGE